MRDPRLETTRDDPLEAGPVPDGQQARQRRRRGSVGGMAAAIYASTLLGLVTGPIAARALGPEGRGEVAAASVYGMLILLFIGLGVPLAVSHRAAAEPRSQPALLATSLRFGSALLPVSAVIAWLVAVGPLAGLSGAARLGAVVIIAAGPLDVINQCQRSMLIARGDLRPMAFLRVLPIALSAAATILLAASGRLGVGTYLATVVISNMAVNAVMWRLLPVRPAGKEPIAPLLRFGLRGVGANLASFGNRQLDQILVLSFVSTRQLGFYAIAVTVANLPIGLGHAIGARVFALAAGPTADRPEVERFLRLAIVSGVVLAAGVALAIPVLLPLLYGSRFSASVIPALLLLPGTAAFAFSGTASQALISLGRPGSVTVSELIALGVTVPGLALAVPTFGISGAAAVSSAAYLVRAVAQVVALRRSGVTSICPTRGDGAELARVVRQGVLRAGRHRRRRTGSGRRARPRIGGGS